jgi:hypothetical protein
VPPEELEPARIYQAPSAVADGPPPASDVEPSFYVVARWKFLVLFVGTFGLYQIVWFYKHWRAQRDSTGQALMPVARALFAIFFAHKLFAAIDAAARQKDPGVAWSPAAQATLFVALSVVGVVIDRASASEEFGSLDWLSIALGLLVVVPLLNAQHFANVATGDPAGERNATLTPLNMVFLAFGTLWWGLLFYGASVTEAGAVP